MISGIYKIINKTNGKYYVGSSCDIKSPKGRWLFHKYLLNNNRHFNKHLQYAWNIYREENFRFLIIEIVSKESLLVVEQKYLDLAKMEQSKCYNMSFIAGRVEMTKEVRKKMSKTRKKLLKNKNNHPMYRRFHTEKSKRKMSLSHKGKNFLIQQKKKLAEKIL